MDPWLERLQNIDSCAVSDAMDMLGHDGYAEGIRPVSVRKRVCGRVTTVLLGPADGNKSTAHLGTRAIDASTDEQVIVVAHQGRTDAGGWGGNLSIAAKERGVRGVIVDGACRDVDEATDIGFPVYATAAVVRTARGRVREYNWNEPVTVAGVQVRPGDYVVADSTGVVFISQDHVEQVVPTAEQIVVKEAAMAERLRRGEASAEVMGGNYETMLHQSDGRKDVR
ncbi:RraA family protein [Alicyclobacillus sp. ALC3]|uniref:RraA family protein n=1 Tax=Alicyclobacillus sp. ALC3 TaxID=2796143 RepID=UPI0023788E5A|nr:RraA family protein [Alicyclobacillus sp. ALC3]WDL97744.1 RraA family protein [Alicyclobacillus sp. ALC3]